MDNKFEKVIKALEKNNIKGIYAENREQAVELVRGMLFDGCTITAGGSVSLQESGVWALINEPKYRFSDRNRPGITPEERQEVFRSVVGCDFFFCSSNAVTENGELVNVDGFANRVSAIAFGPKKVVMIVGKNKIVPDIKAAFLRIKSIAAPKNCVRLGIDTPCSKLGHCVSLLKNDAPDMTDGCAHERRICADYLVSARQQAVGRITVILVDEELGY